MCGILSLNLRAQFLFSYNFFWHIRNSLDQYCKLILCDQSHGTTCDRCIHRLGKLLSCTVYSVRLHVGLGVGFGKFLPIPVFLMSLESVTISWASYVLGFNNVFTSDDNNSFVCNVACPQMWSGFFISDRYFTIKRSGFGDFEHELY